ncbi:hypothetical protein ACFPK9_04045 [Rubritalea spongiae]|uniref:YtxH domain-containing protein n=1 Tax=Rubritalea spongiae TaxID=430797 RepID=A0ABW5E4B0_9BACT
MKTHLIAAGVVSFFIPTSSLFADAIKIPKTPDVSKIADNQVDKAQKKAEKKADEHIDKAEKKVKDEVEEKAGDTGKKVKKGKKTADAIQAITK